MHFRENMNFLHGTFMHLREHGNFFHGKMVISKQMTRYLSICDMAMIPIAFHSVYD
jgi:hypothetical protein